MGSNEQGTREDGPDAEGISLPAPWFLFLIFDAGSPESGGMRISVDGISEITIGRGARRQIIPDGRGKVRVEVPNPSMSTHHARVLRQRDELRLEDLGSRNGTFIDHSRVEGVVGLAKGSLFEAGRTFFLIRQCPLPEGAREGTLDQADLRSTPAGLRTFVPELDASFTRLRRVAKSRIPVPVLVLGPTGTGKELVARALHAESQREGAFVAVNCGAVPKNLVEATFFGHLRGAFSGATRDEPGFARAAHGGTLFLDEIGDLPLASQAVLLRLLQEGEVVPVGATKPVHVDVRVVAATHRRLDQLVVASEFREDLLARLRGFTIELPPLAARREDLGSIMADLWVKIAPGERRFELAPVVARALLRHPWPQNVRELEQYLTAAAAVAQGAILGRDHFPAALFEDASPGALPDERRSPAPPPVSMPDHDPLRVSLEALLAEHGGNVAAVARAMRKAPAQVHRYMARFGIVPDTFRRR